MIRIRFARHRLALGAFFLLQILYGIAVFAEFFSTQNPQQRNFDQIYCPPQIPRFSISEGWHVFAMVQHVDPVTLRKTYTEDRSTVIPLAFFAKSHPYKLWGILPLSRRFIGIDADKPPSAEKSSASFHLLGADRYGRDILSRLIHGARVSLSVGIIAIVITFVLGVTVGGISGYLGGAADSFIQRVIEIVNSLPKLPLWLALGAILPDDWSSLRIYFVITIVLSMLNWPPLARIVRGKLLALREEEYALAAYLLGAGHLRIIFRHLLPGFTSHIIVALTMTVPAMVLGETTLSFLGLGLRPPIISWGVMLQDCMNMTTVANYPWLMMPVVFIILLVLSFNFLGDGLRDAVDPYGGR